MSFYTLQAPAGKRGTSVAVKRLCPRSLLELTDADFQSTPLGWAIHGSEHGWYCRTGNYAATVELLLKAGTKLPEKRTDGTEVVKEMLRRHGAKDFD